MSGEKTLVTGAAGFLGSHVTRQLVARGADVRVLLRPSSNNRAIADLPLEYFTGDLRDAAWKLDFRQFFRRPAREDRAAGIEPNDESSPKHWKVIGEYRPTAAELISFARLFYGFSSQGDTSLDKFGAA